jgi:hypothetical protein
VVAQSWYHDLRSRFTELGIATGRLGTSPAAGTSEGTFDIDQPVASSAREVAAASGRSGRDLPGT